MSDGLDNLPLRDFVAALALVGAAGRDVNVQEAVRIAFAIADEYMKQRGE